MNVGNVLGFLGRGRKSDLGSGGEIFENLPPCRIVGGAATVAFVNDDQVKEARREFPEKLLAVFWPGDGLIEPQVDLVCSVDAALLVQRRCKFDLGAVFALNGLRPR